MVTIENYEEYLMLDADGELDAAAKVALDQFLLLHPELREEAASWQQLRLEPDTTVVYADKEALLKKERKTLTLSWKPIVLAAAAAVAGLLIAIPALQTDFDSKLSGELLVLQIKKPAITPIQKDTTSQYIAALPVSEPVLPKTQSPKKQRKPALLQAKAPTTANNRMVAAIAPKAQDLAIPSTIPTQLQTQQLAPAPVAAAATEPVEETAPRGFALPHVTVAAANKPAIDLIKRGLEARVNQASNAAKAIKDMALVVKLGNNVQLHF